MSSRDAGLASCSGLLGEMAGRGRWRKLDDDGREGTLLDMLDSASSCIAFALV